MHDLIQADK
jgi:hypothetical protein